MEFSARSTGIRKPYPRSDNEVPSGSSRTVLVTGGGGYIGRHLIPALAAKKYSLRIVDCAPVQIAGADAAFRLADVTKLNDLRAVMSGTDVVVHLACLPVNRSFESPVDDFEVNALGTFYALTAAREAGVDRFVYTSTSEVYGAPATCPVREDDPARPASPYGSSKLSGEQSCRIMHQAFGLPTVVLRLFNIYGLDADGRERPTVETLFLKRLLQDKPPVINANPKTAKDFVHVKDVTRAILLAIESKEAAGEVVNIGTGKSTSLSDLAALAARIAGKDLKPEIQPAADPHAAPSVVQADIRKAENLLGYKPAIQLEEGLESICRALRKN